jgi:hypothetical protein
VSAQGHAARRRLVARRVASVVRPAPTPRGLDRNAIDRSWRVRPCVQWWRWCCCRRTCASTLAPPLMGVCESKVVRSLPPFFQRNHDGRCRSHHHQHSQRGCERRASVVGAAINVAVSPIFTTLRRQHPPLSLTLWRHWRWDGRPDGCLVAQIIDVAIVVVVIGDGIGDRVWNRVVDVVVAAAAAAGPARRSPSPLDSRWDVGGSVGNGGTTTNIRRRVCRRWQAVNMGVANPS